MWRILAAAAVLLVFGTGGALAQPYSSPGFDHADFQLNSAQDLFDLCTAPAGNPSHRIARAFCYGYFAGGQHFHNAVAPVPGSAPLACPPAATSREEAVAVFVEFIRLNPQKGGEQPIDAVFEALALRWPCPAAN